ncbi:Oxidoreductase family, NAD-binding rossmann fold protein [Quillaja saponaria]|uniref:Oxidoreductase family, NAD-binding rossmann fold protein n=1 Tax=Quillaja saponaria TaxID=32244 RepID=A0AAD7PMC4_QUISA|nr:Oxidoreductase family, NAD-binding rossmann fold protein [Quillaja saponaria]
MSGKPKPNPIRFGIMGCAEIARKVARAITLAPNSTLYAIGSRSIDKAKKFAAMNKLSDAVKIYGSYNQVLNDPGVDAVYIPLPTSLHVQWAVLAAKKKKHLLLEKPTALDVAELDQILEACESNGVQFMDGSMWWHHPRTAKMKELLSDSQNFGKINYIYSTSTMSPTPQFLENNIRVKPDLDALGALGDLAWYCIGASLWAKNYQLPTTIVALPDITRNSDGVILSCTASFEWNQLNGTTVATIHCSYLSHSSMDLAIYGSKGSLHVNDLIIPYQENSASFDYAAGAKFTELHLGWNKKPEELCVGTELPQEALMVQELARLVEGIRNNGCRASSKWPEISRKTQLVVDAVKKSIDLGCKPVNL